MSGFVKVHRTLLDHPDFRTDAEAMAFAWLVVRAAWKDTRVRYKGRPIELKRGQLAVSVRDMAEHLERSKDWVSRFLQRISNRDMIATATATGVNIITICNYDKYQGSSDTSATEVRQGAGQHRDSTATQNKKGRTEEEKKEEANASLSISPSETDAPHPPGDEPPAKQDPGDVEAAFEMFRKAAEHYRWPIPRVMNPKRQKALAARIRQHGLDGWREALKRAGRSPLLAGPDPPSWFGFDWLTSDTNFLKLIEGNYDRGFTANRPQPAPGQENPFLRAQLAAEREGADPPDGRHAHLRLAAARDC